MSDDRDGTLRGVISALLATRNVTPKNKAVPFRTAWFMAGLMGAAWRVLGLKGEPPITRQMLRLIGKSFTISIDKAKTDLGYAPRVTWEAGLAAMQQQGSPASVPSRTARTGTRVAAAAP